MTQITTKSGTTYYATQNSKGLWSAHQAGSTPRWENVKTLDSLKECIRWQHKDDKVKKLPPYACENTTAAEASFDALGEF